MGHCLAMPHVVQRCSSLGDSVGAGLSSPWLLFVAVRGCSWLFVAMHGGMVALLAARHEMPCGSCPASVSIHFPAMCVSSSPLCSCHDISAGTVRQSVKREIPATLEDGDTGIVTFSVYTAGNRFPWADVLFLCAVWWCVPPGMYAVWLCVPSCGHVVRGRKSSLSLLHGRVSPM